MFKKAVHIFIILSFIALIGCSSDDVTEAKKDNGTSSTSVLYENPDQGVRVYKTDGWVIEKETATSVKFKNEKMVAIISVVPKQETIAEMKQELLAAAGKVTVTDEGPNYISWKSDRKESIHTNVFLEETKDRHVITTILMPHNVYESNREKMEAFRWNIELY